MLHAGAWGELSSGIVSFLDTACVSSAIVGTQVHLFFLMRSFVAVMKHKEKWREK
jgi:hypothetical protein